jgi:predicted metal-binding membrane protein
MNTRVKFYAVAALVFIASAAMTVRSCLSMSATDMPCMLFMPMGDQTWLGCATDFLIMWAVMMTAMMLPSLMWMIGRRQDWVSVSLGYLLVWTLLGAVVFPLGSIFTSAGGWVVLVAGALQFTRWKRRHLDCCREPLEGSGFRHGLRLGVHCVYCCAGLTAALLAIGVMDLRAMIVVTVAITVERVLPETARWIGAGLIALGAALL